MESPEDDLYQIVPRFVTEKFKYLKGYLLKPICREFEWSGREFQLFITPAFVEDEDGQIRNYFPGLQEKQVETALIELAVQDTNSFFDVEKKLSFTLMQLENHLTAGNNPLSQKQIKHSIEILKGANFMIKGADYVWAFRLIDTLVIFEDEFDVRFTAYFGNFIVEEIKKYTLNQPKD